jgi:hypothetical protein
VEDSLPIKARLDMQCHKVDMPQTTKDREYGQSSNSKDGGIVEGGNEVIHSNLIMEEKRYST